MTDYTIISNQQDCFEHLETIVNKHKQSSFNAPISDLQKSIFNELNKLKKSVATDWILDAGCGTGRSTYALADAHPDHCILGIDRSESRLNQLEDFRNHDETLIQIKENAYLLRADLISQWMLMSEDNWFFEKIYLLYPNPYPKKSRFKQRFHGHPIFPSLMNLSNQFEVRSNWDLYLQEFEIAAKLCKNFDSTLKEYKPGQAITNFEEKYLVTDAKLYKLTLDTEA